MSFQPLDPENNPLPWLRRGAAIKDTAPSANGVQHEGNKPEQRPPDEPPSPDDAFTGMGSHPAHSDPTHENPISRGPSPEDRVPDAPAPENPIPEGALSGPSEVDDVPAADLQAAEEPTPQLPGFPDLPRSEERPGVEPVDPGLLTFETNPPPDTARLDETAELPRTHISTPTIEPLTGRTDPKTAEMPADRPQEALDPAPNAPLSPFAQDDAPAADPPLAEPEASPQVNEETSTPDHGTSVRDAADLDLADDLPATAYPNPDSDSEKDGPAAESGDQTAATGSVTEAPVASPASISSTSARLNLSEILREAELQGAPVSRASIFADSVPATATPPAPAPPTTPGLLGDDEYPSLLVRPRDRTEPFLDMMPVAMADDVDQRFRDLERLPTARDPLSQMGAADYVEPPPARERRFQADAAGQVPWKILAILLFALSLGAFIFALTGWTVTAEDEATDVNRRIAAELTEVDRYIANNEEAIREAEPGDNGRVTLPDFPISVTLSAEEARELEGDELRDVILDRAAARTYQDGVQVYGTDAGLFDDLSTPGLVRFGIEVMQDGAHGSLLILMVVLAVLTAALAGLIVLVTRRGGRITALGIGVVSGGAISLLGSIVMRLLFDRATSSQDDVLADGLGAIADDVTYLFLRNSLVFVVIGAVIVAIGVAISMLDRRQNDELDHIETEAWRPLDAATPPADSPTSTTA